MGESELFYPRLSFHVSGAETERLSECLTELGALCVTIEADQDEQLLIASGVGDVLWQRCVCHALFKCDVRLDKILARLTADYAPAALPPHSTSRLQDSCWEQAWMERFQPLSVTPTLWICPSWCTPPAPDALNIFLDPGLAFGTGRHPTTAMCLRALEAALMGSKVRRVIDYGCGSGVLAIAAAKLGATEIHAVDVDENALHGTRVNAVKNAVMDRITVNYPAALGTVRCDLLIANLLLGPILDLREEFSRRVVPGGRLVLSGLLNSQVAQVMAAYEDSFKFAHIVSCGEWARCDARRRGVR